MSAASSKRSSLTEISQSADAGRVRVGGFVPLSTADFPGRLSAVVFCQGCPWQCAYCHNPHLIPAVDPGLYDWPEILEWLNSRRGLLDAVVFSGGEPTLQRGLAQAMRAVRELGFEIGLHTAGAYPERLREVLPLCDWVGLDIKAPFARYDALTRVPRSDARVRASLELLVESGVAHECRTTVHPSLLSRGELLALAGELLIAGAECYVLQPFRFAGCRDADLVAEADGDRTSALLRATARRAPGVLVRGA